MPEGPEIRRAAARLESVLRGKTIEDAYFGQPHLRRRAAALVGQRVDTVSAHSKAIVTRFSGGLNLYSHNQLYGRWYIRRRGKLPSTERVLRVALHTNVQSALLYSASDIELLDNAALAAHPYLARLGPAALDETVHWRDIAAQLMAPRFRGRRLAGLYLDQSCIAGMGNYLRSEILHYAKLNPAQTPQVLSRGELGRLARTTLEITRRAYATAGVTNAPARVKSLQKRGEPRSVYRFAVFDRAGAPCYHCGTAIERISASQRRLYLCPRCQSS